MAGIRRSKTMCVECQDWEMELQQRELKQEDDGVVTVHRDATIQHISV